LGLARSTPPAELLRLAAGRLAGHRWARLLGAGERPAIVLLALLLASSLLVSVTMGAGQERPPTYTGFQPFVLPLPTAGSIRLTLERYAPWRATTPRPKASPEAPNRSAPARPAPRPAPKPRPPSVAAARAYAKEQIGATQFVCLDRLWSRESRWDPLAKNRSSGAYGIPQALPGSKMAWAGSDWRTDPLTQVRWGLHYIAGRYGSACAALDHS
jgi:hypothetical protein